MISVPKYVWIDLELEDGRRRDLAGRCFYLGHGVETTRGILNGFLPNEAINVLEVTALCGYSDEKYGLSLSH